MSAHDKARHVEPITVRWGDVDSMGHVNNAKYFTYCESARMTYFAAVGMNDHRETERTARPWRRPTSTSANRCAGPPARGGDPRLRDRPQQLQDGIRDLPPRLRTSGWRTAPASSSGSTTGPANRRRCRRGSRRRSGGFEGMG